MSISISDASSELVIKTYAARHFERSVDEIKLEKLAGDASTRQYYRVIFPDGQSFVVSRYPEPLNATTHPTCQVTRLFLQAGLPVPRILDVCGQEGLMLLDDLGDIRLQDRFTSATEPARRELYQQAIDLIIRIQDTTALATETGCVAAHLAFDEQKLSWELGFFYVNFFEQYLRLTHEPALKSEIFGEFGRMSQELALLPRVLCHRDYHSRNLMLHQGQLFIIDHQDARMGPVSYDLASLLGDPYIELKEDSRKELYDYFVASRMKSGSPPFGRAWREGFEREYQLMLVQRLLKATGTYAYQTAVVGNDVYLPYIPRAIRGALEAVRALDRFHVIRATLEQLDQTPFDTKSTINSSPVDLV